LGFTEPRLKESQKINGHKNRASINKFWSWLNYITGRLLVAWQELEMANGNGEQPLRIRDVSGSESERELAR